MTDSEDENENARKIACASCIANALEKAKELCADKLRFSKDPTKRKLGVTTAADDIAVINRIIDHVLISQIDFALDHDANPRFLLRRISWDDFRELYKDSMADWVADIENVETKLKTPAEVERQLSGLFHSAKEMLDFIFDKAGFEAPPKPRHHSILSR